MNSTEILFMLKGYIEISLPRALPSADITNNMIETLNKLNISRSINKKNDLLVNELIGMFKIAKLNMNTNQWFVIYDTIINWNPAEQKKSNPTKQLQPETFDQLIYQINKHSPSVPMWPPSCPPKLGDITC